MYSFVIPAFKREWIVFLDADSYPDKDLIKEIINHGKSDRYIGFGAIVKVIDGKWWFKLALESKNWSMQTFEEEYFIKKLKQRANEILV